MHNNIDADIFKTYLLTPSLLTLSLQKVKQ